METVFSILSKCAEFALLRNRRLGPLAVTVLPIALARRAAQCALSWPCELPGLRQNAGFEQYSGKPATQSGLCGAFIHLRRTSFWPLPARAWRRCSRQAAKETRRPGHRACPSETRAALLLGQPATARGRARTSRLAPCGHGCSAHAPPCRGVSETARVLYRPAALLRAS